MVRKLIFEIVGDRLTLHMITPILIKSKVCSLTIVNNFYVHFSGIECCFTYLVRKSLRSVYITLDFLGDRLTLHLIDLEVTKPIQYFLTIKSLMILCGFLWYS